MEATAALLIALVATVCFVVWQRRQKARLLRNIRARWKTPRPAPSTSELTLIALYDQFKAQDSVTRVDEKTWTDLDLDQVFFFLDRTCSRVGQQCLFHLLRTPQREEEPLLTFDQAVNNFRNVDLRENLQLELHRLDHKDALLLPHLFLGELPRVGVVWRVLFPTLTVATVVSAAIAISYHSFLWVLIPLAVVNMLISSYYHHALEPFLQPLRFLNILIGTSRRIGRTYHSSVISGYARKLAVAGNRLSGLQRKTAWLALDRYQDEIVSVIYHYVNMAFLVEANCFVFSVEELLKKRAHVAAIYETLGYLDAAISVCSVRDNSRNVIQPVFIESQKACSFTQLYHPLLAKAVPNDLAVERKSILLTGSNMSGKSTCVRTVGVNVVLAQTIHTCFAKEYRAPYLAVKACLGATDSLMEGKSHYLAEVQGVLSLVCSKEAQTTYLFLIDELFRGTNTMERVAAEKAVLEYLNRGNNIVLAATHDLELVELLDGRYECLHFREVIEDRQMSFDFKVQKGVSSTRNAIAILEMTGYPEPIVREATRTFEALRDKNTVSAIERFKSVI